MASIMNLHLQYRLWISNMNEHINVLRILDDYIQDCKSKTKDAHSLDKLGKYKEQFVEIRKELDDIRHEMYLNKMKLAAMEKAGTSGEDDFEKSINHEDIKHRYENFRSTFKELKNEFKQFDVE